MIDREKLGRDVMEVSQVMADGYTRAISDLQSQAEQEANSKCAIAASNTGYFILQRLGFSIDEIRILRAAYQQSWAEIARPSPTS